MAVSDKMREFARQQVLLQQQKAQAEALRSPQGPPAPVPGMAPGAGVQAPLLSDNGGMPTEQPTPFGMKVWMNSLRRKQPYDEAAGRRELNDYLAKWEKDKGLPPSDLEISQGVGADAAGEQQGPPEPGGQVAAGTGAGNTPNDSSVFDNLDPATAQALMGLGDKDRQLAYAEKMRDQDAPSGRYVSNGRIYVGASPIEQGMSAYTRFRGAKDAKRIGEEQTQGRLSVLDLLRGKKQNVDSAPETVADNM